LEQLVQLSYDLKKYQVQVKGAAWIATDPYVIQARIPTPVTEPERMRMLQSALAARFHLSVHRETRPAPVYLLQVANHGPRLQPASQTAPCGRVNIRQGTFQSDCLSLDDFAEALQEFVLKDHPVLNRTGLNKEGRYRFALEYSLGDGDDPAAGPAIFSALPDQLGLSLKGGKAPVETLVIEHAQRPQPN
jgi:uncharacterized protein (TIGR03435 family)